ncbi:hypothetical protein QBA57_21380 [Streptomyces scabiei]|uniref:hypothetical protein n=1 Tax=Streptomyces scabiei TaxID=1930 RepID=UPI000765875B|nr:MULTISPECIES: hypothetical protein [Streptomyces]MBP5862797.1 hypothetical protein [Streptomyces sp. LBUM 1484]MBP5876740.1 hypothetical protein [Streptomyces sp. LBUM 1477]MBP5884527.1 hypothetical protein [Streptomyces sp. LBUM 1487]MBP5915873.1 hypothetical protein [Streptomyces sp. LBUM 1486]MDX2626505.1 hypothetical protein [Streptomyces scabiei]
MIHRPTLVSEIRELPPENGWACFEATGRACAVCHCGLNTGFVDKAEALHAAKRHHVPGIREAGPIGPEPTKVDVHVRLVDVAADLKTFLRQMIRRGY